MLVQLSERPEFAVVGIKCRVLMPTSWIGGTGYGDLIDCPGVIVEVVKRNDQVTSISVDLKRSPKYNNCSVKNLLVLAREFDDVFVESEIESVKVEKRDNNITIITRAV